MIISLLLAAVVAGTPVDPLTARIEADDADLAVTRGSDGTMTRGTPVADAYYRWVGNFGSAPVGWPGEAGYWMGQRIWQRWYDRQSDKHQTIRRLLTVERPRGILAGGRLPADLSAPQHLR